MQGRGTGTEACSFRRRHTECACYVDAAAGRAGSGIQLPNDAAKVDSLDRTFEFVHRFGFHCVVAFCQLVVW
jgi:hypothetical protein